MIVLSALDGTFLKAVKDSSLVMLGRASVFLEDTNDRLVIAFNIAGKGFIHRMSNFLLGSPSLSMTPWLAYTRVTEFFSVMQGIAYTPSMSSNTGYIYYVAGMYKTLVNTMNMMIGGYESADNNALWFMAV